MVLDDMCCSIEDGDCSVWAKEMLEITNRGERVLEIGCGSGETSLVLAIQGRMSTALDYSHKSIDLVEKAANRLNCKVDAVFADATKDLPFSKQYFDVIFQAGLLEHFDSEHRVRLLKNWKRYGKKMISLIPNAHSVAYRYGKYLQEKNGTWEYGLEIPQSSLKDDFRAAGIRVIEEYTIGENHALAFLPEDHFVRKALEEVYNLNNDHIRDWWQGYLLVTIGECYNGN